MPEDQRRSALASYRITPGMDLPDLDHLTRLAQKTFDASICAVTLLDETNQWLVSKAGTDTASTPREQAFCSHTVLLGPNGVMVIEDATRDPRFAANPLVLGHPNIRFYAGAAITDPEGRNLGAFCIIDERPRARPAQAELELLVGFARQAMTCLQLNNCQRELAEQARFLAMTESLSNVGRWRLDFATGRIEWSEELYRIHGRQPSDGPLNRDQIAADYLAEDREQLFAHVSDLRMAHGTHEAEARIQRPDGAQRQVLLKSISEHAADGAATALFGIVQDVTEQRRAFERLARSEQHMRLLADNMADVVTRIRFDGSSNYISPAIERLIGYKPAEMAGRPAQAFVYGPDVPLILEAFTALSRGEDERTVQHRAAHRSGAPVPVETRLRLVRDEEGRPREIVAVIRDMTERRALEARLAASESRASRIVEAAHQAIVTIGEHGLVKGWNPYAEVIFGWSASEALGRPLTDLYLPEDLADAHRQGLAQFLEHGEGWIVDQRLEVPARRKDGQLITIELNLNAAHGPEGWRFTALIQDITARKEQQELFETSFENAPIGMALVWPDGGFKQVNPAFCALVGYSAEALLETGFQAITHPDDLAPDETELARLLNGEIDDYAMDKRYVHKDGSVVWVRLSVALVREHDGRPRHFIAQVQDLTARVAAQAALQQRTEELVATTADLAAARDAADAANRAKSQFLANMSHELRTPLNAIIGFSQLLAERGTLCPEDLRSVVFVRDASHSLNKLINDLLDFSKLEAGGVQLEIQSFELRDVVYDALTMVETKADEKGLELKVTGDEPGPLMGDGFRLRQVLLNFLSNAVKFTAQGAVTVDVAATPAPDGGQKVRISVSDQGIGIAPEHLPAMFKRFSQADGSVSRKFGGTGLGLAISRELIELMGGQVGVDSTPGEGSTFWLEVCLPKGERRRAVDPGDGAPVAVFPGRRILVVDDVALNRELLQVLLERHGCSSHFCGDGAEAVAACEVDAYDMVLMDVQMPVMDGLAAARALRERAYDAPILAITAGGARDEVAACLAAGMDDYLIKPFNAAELERLLVQWLEPGSRQSARHVA